MSRKGIPKSAYRTLIAEARKARRRAYAPFSRFKVGAAVLTQTGEIFSGANVENSSYGMTNCAERSAIQKAVNAGHRRIVAIGVIGDTEMPIAPCGACRQVVFEFGDDIEVVMANLKGNYRVETISTLLPLGFRLHPETK